MFLCRLHVDHIADKAKHTFFNLNCIYLLSSGEASGNAGRRPDDILGAGSLGQSAGVKNLSDKVRDLGNEKFIAMVLAKDEEFARKVSESEIDAEAIITKAKPSIDKYGIATGVAYAIARLKEAVEEANSDVVKGMLVGERDRFGTNSPVRIPLLSSKGDHMDLINWGTSVKYGDSKIAVPFPSIATLKVVNEGDYKGVPNIRIVAIDHYEELSLADTVSRLKKVAKTVGEVDGGDELSVVVIKGKIKFISPATRWKDKEKDGNWQIYMPNQRDNPITHPVMQITLENDNMNQVRVNFDRQRNAAPNIVVEDFVELCADAVAHSSDPTEQAKFLGGLVKDREVIVVGFMTKYNPQANANYIEVGGYAMYDATVETTQSKVSDDEDDAPVKRPAAKKQSEKPVSSKGSDKKEPAEKTASKPAAKKQSPADKLKEKIRTYCEMFGVAFTDVTSKEVIDHFKLDGVIEESTVDTVIDELRSE